MTPFTGRAIGLGFAALWLLLGAAALPLPWRYAIGAAGLLAIAALAWRARHLPDRRTGLFRMHRYWIAVVGEVVALMLANRWLAAHGLTGYLLPVVAIVVGLHFIGLWWAGGGGSYLWLAAALTAVGGVALLLPPGSAAMQAVAGLGSAAALAVAAGTGVRR